MTDLDKAAEICAQVAADRIRWGKHGGFNQYSEEQVADALVALHNADVFGMQGEKEERIKANRAKGAAEARAVKFKLRASTLESKLEVANERIAELEKELENAVRKDGE